MVDDCGRLARETKHEVTVYIPYFSFADLKFYDHDRRMVFCEDSEFLNSFDVLFYGNGITVKSDGYVSVLFKMKKNFRKKEFQSSYFWFSCTVSVVDSAGDLRYTTSFSNKLDMSQKDISQLQKMYEPFGLNRYVRRLTLLDANDDMLQHDTLKLQCEITLSKYKLKKWHDIIEKDGVKYYFNVWKTNFEQEYITPVKAPDGHLSYKLTFLPSLKKILCKRSNYFESMMSSGMIESITQSMDIIAEEYSAFLSMLFIFVYGTFEHVESMQEYCDLYEIADKYGIHKVKKLCVYNLVHKIDVQNVLEIVSLADKFQDQNLKNFSLHYIRTHWDAVISTEDWKHLSEQRPDLKEEISQGIDDTRSLITNEKYEIKPVLLRKLYARQRSNFEFYT